MRTVLGFLMVVLLLTPSIAARAATGELFFAEWAAGPNGGDHAIGSWLINCSKDSFSDRRSCTVKAKVRDGFSDLTLIVVDKNVGAARVGGTNRFPSTPSYVRVDDAPAVTWTTEDGPASGFGTGLIARIRAGHRIRTRWYAFPNSAAPRDQELSLVGVTAALDRARQVISGDYSYTADQALQETRKAGALMADPMIDVSRCEPDHVAAADRRIQAALASRPDLHAAFVESRASILPLIEPIRSASQAKAIDCAGKKIELDRFVAGFLEKVERFK